MPNHSKMKQKVHKSTFDFVLCLPTAPEHRSCPSVWLITQWDFTGENWFSLCQQVNCRQLLDYGWSLHPLLFHQTGVLSGLNLCRSRCILPQSLLACSFVLCSSYCVWKTPFSWSLHNICFTVFSPLLSDRLLVLEERGLVKGKGFLKNS